MPISKPDFNLIFASQAPSQDLPAAFDNYARGWDEARKNNGKPTIKQFNYLIQQLDLKALWMIQNGAALPFDETVDYAEGAVVVKDGSLQQLVGGVWKKPTQSADQIFDESGRSQQLINNDTINAKNKGVKNNGVSIKTDFLALIESVQDGDEIFLPRVGDDGVQRDYYWDASGGTLNVNKNISIRSDGAIIRVKGYDGWSPFISFNAPVDVTINAANMFYSLNKNNPRLYVKTTAGITNPADYFVVLTSTEVMHERPTYDEPYYKNITLDIANNEWDLRDPLPFTFDDLSKVTARFVKKQTPTYIGGFKIMPTEDHPQETVYFQATYKSRLTIDVMTVDCRGRQTSGTLVHYNGCMGVVTKDSGCLGSNKPDSDSYAFLQSTSSYLQFIRCFYQDYDYSEKSSKGIGGRHGFMNTYDSCLTNGVDDHWGYGGLVKNMHMSKGITWCGGSLTVKDCTSKDVLVSLRTDTPYADGSLVIENSYGRLGTLYAYGYSNDVQAAKVFAKHKLWDSITIKGTFESAKMSRSMMLIKEPHVEETEVYRDTILTIDCTYIQTKGSSQNIFEAYPQSNSNGQDVGAYSGDMESKRLFSIVNMNITHLCEDDSSVESRRSLIMGTVAKEWFIRSNDLSFQNLKGDEITIEGKLKDSKTVTNTVGCNKLFLDNFKFNGGSAIAVPTTAASQYPNMAVHLNKVYAQHQNIIYPMFGSKIKSSRGGVFEQSGKIANGWDLTNYDRDFCVTYIVATAITLAENTSSAELSVAFANANYDSFVDALLVAGDGSVVVDMVRKRSSGVEGNQYFKLRNTSAASVTIDAGTIIKFKVS